MSSNTSVSMMISSASTPEKDSSSTSSGEFSKFSTFLNQLPKRVVDNIEKVPDVGTRF